MNLLRTQVLFFTLVVLSACSGVAPERSPTADSTALEVLEGRWNWVNQDCNRNPFTLEVTPDRKSLVLTFAEPDTAGRPMVSVYRLLGQGSDFVRGQIEGEDRLTDQGEPVVWDFLLLGQNSFCWHRTDWPPYECTRQLRRCPTAVTSIGKHDRHRTPT